MAFFTTLASRPVLLASRLMQWASAVIVMGLASAFINKYSTGEHIIYAEVIATTATAFYIPAVVTALITKFHWHWIPLDLVYSYLWLVVVVFEAQDYNYLSCSATDPHGLSSCSQKLALEAFAFLAFFFTVFSLIMQTLVWVNERSVAGSAQHEKIEPTRPSGEIV